MGGAVAPPTTAAAAESAAASPPLVGASPRLVGASPPRASPPAHAPAPSAPSAPSRAGEPIGPRSYVRFEIVDFNTKALCKTVPARHASGSVFMYMGAIALGANSEVLTVPAEVRARPA